MSKVCFKCKSNLTHADYYKCRRGKDGLDAYCKTCRRAISKTHDTTLTGRFGVYKRNAKRRSYDFELTISQFKSLTDSECHYCGLNDDFVGIDRVDNEKGYTFENSRPCCQQCNNAKATMTEAQYIEFISRVYLHVSRDKA